jgi:galactokinase
MTMDPRDTLISAFRERFDKEPLWVGEAPGRVNLIGEHTDYNDGFVLPVAIDYTTLVAAAPSMGSHFRVWSLDMKDEAVFDSAELKPNKRRAWSNYVIGVAWAYRQAGYQIPPLDLAVSSRVPRGAGLSSSAALEVSVAVVFAAASGLSIAPVDLALIAHRAEAEFVGVPCGIMDQFISSLGKDGNALLIDCRTRDYQPVPMELDRHGLALVVVDSGVRRRLATSAYTERRRQCEQAVSALNRLVPREITSLRDVSEADLLEHRGELPRVLFKRARHVVSENARVLGCVNALRSRRYREVGSLLVESHRSLKEDFEVSSPELDLLVELSLETQGVLGARLTGAGFGGCTVNLISESSIDRFRTNVLTEYQKKSGKTPRMYICRASTGARLI